MAVKFAFVGFRHAHITSLYTLAQQRNDIEIVAACEEDAETRAALAQAGVVNITHASYAEMLRGTECDVVACGDFYAIRGERLLQAIEAGKHIIGDKPFCARLNEFYRIEAAVRERKVCVGCMLDLPDFAPFQTLHKVLREGIIGEVHTIAFAGQHPLFWGSRPKWYFEPGKHLGTINDIAVHAIDIIPWLTGQSIAEITAARAWNAKAKDAPFFQDAGQIMLRLDNNAGVLGDVSYLNPDSHGYALPAYWRMGLHGTDGCVETALNSAGVQIFRNGEPFREEPLLPARTGGYLEDFLAELRGEPSSEGLNSTRVFRSTRIALQAQAAAETGRFPAAV